MVLKVGKFGIRSGNTFKASNSKFLRQYRKQSVLVRTRTVHGEEGQASARESDENVGREDIRSDHVAYSLNKKARWLVPALIKDIIHNGEEDCGIQLVEAHKVLKKANCVGIYTTHAPSGDGCFTKASKRKRRGYLQEGSILRAGSAGSRQQRRRRLRQGLPVIEDEGEGAEMVFEQPSIVRYDVVYPSPISSSVTHNPKYLGHETKKPETVRIPRGRSRRRVRLNGNLLEELEAVDDEFDYDVTDDEVDVHDDDVPQRERNYDVVLADLVYYANAATKLARFSAHSRNSSLSDKDVETKGRVIYEEPAAPGADETKANKKKVLEEKPIHTALEPVYVLLPNEQLDPYNLRVMFQDAYIECDCFPRKFVLDISRRVSDLAFLRNNNQVANAFIVFEYDVENEINNRHESVYKIMFNTNFAQSVQCIKIETLFDYMETNVDEIINRTCFFVETLEEGIVQTERSMRTLQNEPDRVDQLMKWKTQSYKPTCRHYVQNFLSTTNEAIANSNTDYTVVSWFAAETSDDSGDVSSPVGRFCCVCYDTIDREQTGTAIIACGHWACNACWRQYLESKMNEMTTCSIRCPEFDCDKKVDPGTILSLVNLRNILKFAKRCHDTDVEQHEDKLWCPMVRCGRVMRITSSEAMSAQCACGEKVCVRCLGKDHFPAPCSSIDDYHKRLKNSGDEGILPLEGLVKVTVRGKSCPSCNLFVEKKGGCPYMACVCGKTFCWGCGRKFHAGILHGSDCQKGHRDTHNTVPVELKQEDLMGKRKRERWYQMAVTHRVNQHPLKVRLMGAKGLGRLAGQVQRYLTQAAKRGEPVDMQFEDNGKTYSSDTNKVYAFLKSSVQLYTEINHLVENCALLMESDNLPDAKRRRLLYAMKRLSTFGEVLFTLFTKEQPPKYFVEQIVQVRQHIFTCINAVSRNVAQVQAN